MKETISVSEMEDCINIKAIRERRYTSLSISKESLPELIHKLEVIDMEMLIKKMKKSAP